MENIRRAEERGKKPAAVRRPADLSVTPRPLCRKKNRSKASRLQKTNPHTTGVDRSVRDVGLQDLHHHHPPPKKNCLTHTHTHTHTHAALSCCRPLPPVIMDTNNQRLMQQSYDRVLNGFTQRTWTLLSSHLTRSDQKQRYDTYEKKHAACNSLMIINKREKNTFIEFCCDWSTPWRRGRVRWWRRRLL